MPAPRCPPIHKPPIDWEKWIDKYLTYDYRMFPKKMRLFNEYKKDPMVSYMVPARAERVWKYYAYYQLTGRKHRTLTI